LDGRKSGRNLVGTGKHGSRSTSASKGLLIFAALDYTARGINAAASYYDTSITNKHIGILQNNALVDLRNALQSGLIPQEYLNYDDLSVILNSIFQGDGFGNDELEQLGKDIYKWYNIYQPFIESQDGPTALDSYWEDRNLYSNKRRATSPIIWSNTPDSND